MRKEIESLEDLNTLLGEKSFDMNFWRAKNGLEQLAWHLLAHICFDPIVLKEGTREKVEVARDAEEESLKNYVEDMKSRYNDFYTADNQELREWLTTTPLENIAAYTTYFVRRNEIDKVSNCYDAAQDHYADNWKTFRDFEHGDISGREFVETFYQQVDELNAHVEEGKKLGLTMDEIVLHDAMWGLLPSAFDPELTVLAQEIQKEALRQLPSHPYIWSQKGKEAYAPKMLRYAAHKLEEKGFDIGFSKQQYTIEQGYLLDYFSQLYWREADAKPED